MPEAESGEAGPDTLAARSELANLIAEAAGGLSDRDRSVLELAYRHGLDGPELAEALGVSAANAKKMTQRLRETIERSLGALLVSRRVRSNPSACPELGEILAGWDGQFSVLMRKRIARHIESCSVCDEERRRLVNPVALLGGAPVFIPAPAWLRERTLDQIHLTASSTPMASVEATQKAEAAGDDEPTELLDTGEAAAAESKFLSRRMLLPAFGVLALILALGVIIAVLHQRDARFAPANVTKSPPTTQMPRVVAPAPTSPPPTVAPSEVPITTTIPAVTSLPPVESTVAPPPVTSLPPPVTTTVPVVPPPGRGPSSGTSTPPVFTPTATVDEPPPPSETETPTTPVETEPPVTTQPPTKTSTKPPVTKPPTATVGPVNPPTTTGGPIIY